MTERPVEGQFGNVDTSVAVDGDAMFLNGWLSGARGEDRAVLVDPAGGSAEVDLGQRFIRQDVISAGGSDDELHGFACLAALPRGGPRRTGLRLELHDPSGPKSTLGVPDPISDPGQGRRHVLRLLRFLQPSDQFMANHVFPAVERLTRRIQEDLAVRGVVEQGPVPTSAEVSIIVPIYGSLDLLTPQVALLARDPEIREAEVVLVLDSPELEDELNALSHDLYELYRLPLRTVTLRRNGGFGNANNFGVENSSAPRVLLLNSDVFPDQPGWLSPLLDSLGSTEVAAAGPKLLYEDGSLQHAGMYFERDPASRHWQNLHYHKGMPGNLPAANIERRVPALTAACLLLAREDFEAIEGFDPSYVLGDYEDSDLCLRLQESGRQCRFVPAASLYHLERQSFAGRLSKPGGSGHVTYNRWLFTHRWSDRIEGLSAELSEPSPAIPTGL